MSTKALLGNSLMMSGNMHLVPLCLQCGSIAINLGTVRTRVSAPAAVRAPDHLQACPDAHLQNLMKLGHNKRDVLLDTGAKTPGVQYGHWDAAAVQLAPPPPQSCCAPAASSGSGNWDGFCSSVATSSTL